MIDLDRIIYNAENMSLAKEIIEFAKQRKTISDYINFALRQKKIGNKSYKKRISILNFLIDSSFINREHEQLFIDDTSLDLYIEDRLDEGNKNLWEIIKLTKKKYFRISKFNAKKLKEIGDKGEEYIIYNLKEKLPSELHKDIIHEAKYNDNAGYDIKAPSIYNYNITTYFEIKTTVIPGDIITFYFSRSEYEKSKREKNWYLLLVQIINNECIFLGHINPSLFKNKMPEDIAKNIRWNSTKIKINKRDIVNNYPKTLIN